MTFGNIVLICAAVLIVSLALPALFIVRTRWGSFCLAFAVGYMLFVGIMSLWYFPGEKDAQAELFWVAPGLLTLPASLLIMVLPSSGMADKLVWLVVLGMAQFGGIGILVDLIATRIKKGTANHTSESASSTRGRVAETVKVNVGGEDRE